MVSRRNLFASVLMMGVLFVLIQFFLVAKDQGNRYMENDHYVESSWWQNNVFVPQILEARDTVPERDYVVYVGSEESDAYPVVAAWCTYRKMDLMRVDGARDYRRDLSHRPRAILINGEETDYEKDIPTIKLWEQDIVPLIFVTLPKKEKVADSVEFMRLIGVDGVMPEEEEPLVGIHVLDGFLLGGETFYRNDIKKESEEEAKEEALRMDLSLDIPRYHVFNNTKSYIIGMYKETPEETQKQPSLLWRYTTTSTNVFVFNGDFMRDMSGIGYLTAVMAEIRAYDIYPVINAQELTLVNFPGLAPENTDKLMEVYSRDQSAFYRDLVWPRIVSVIENSKLIPTSYMAPHMDYSSSQAPDVSEMVYYLKQLKEYGGEMGISMDLLMGTKLADKVAVDQAFLTGIMNNYRFGALYADEEELDDVIGALDAQHLHQIKTIVSDRKDMTVGYLAEDITLQGITCDINPYYYSQDLKMRGYETALGYSNILFDMASVSWPRGEEDEWQKTAKRVTANLMTYWNAYDGFARVTASEGNRRVRNFLALDFSQNRSKNVIAVKIENFWEEAWFVLRLHGEQIDEIEGGGFTEIEDGVFLVCATSDYLRIRVGTADSNKKFVQ